MSWQVQQEKERGHQRDTSQNQLKQSDKRTLNTTHLSLLQPPDDPRPGLKFTHPVHVYIRIKRSAPFHRRKNRVGIDYEGGVYQEPMR